ncbi:MAG: hypothetical protein IPP94_19665 [Ignavibacteria bacterium]|nr:hypothetical protein [Ignavibacteria bacterium]
MRNFSCGTIGIVFPMLFLWSILITERVFAQQVHTGCDSVIVTWMQQGDKAVIKYQIWPPSEKSFDVSLKILLNHIPARFEARHLSGAVGRGKFARSSGQITWLAAQDLPNDYDNDSITFEVVVREVAERAPAANKDALAGSKSSEQQAASEPASKDDHVGGGLSWWMYAGAAVLATGGATLFILSNSSGSPTDATRLPDPPSSKPGR